MDAARELLSLDNHASEEDLSPTVIRAKTSIFRTQMSTQAKVEDTYLRRRIVDRLPELLKLAEEVRAKLPSRPVLDLRGVDTP